MSSEANINFKISRLAEKCLFKPPSLTADTIATFVDTSFKYFTVI